MRETNPPVLLRSKSGVRGKALPPTPLARWSVDKPWQPFGLL
jgi:hypothetical protein